MNPLYLLALLGALGSVVTSYVKMAFYTNCGERE